MDYLVISQRRVQDFTLVHRLVFAEGIAAGHHDSAFELPGDTDGVDDRAAFVSGDDINQFHLTGLRVNFNFNSTEAYRLTLQADGVFIEAEAACEAKTGIEMEALTAVAVAALTVYDMCKAVDKSMSIEDIRLLKKTKNAVHD